MDNDLALLLSSSMQSYVFYKIFEKENNGKTFDVNSWMNDVKELISDPMFSLSKEKQEKLGDVLAHLDKYAIEEEDINKGHKLTLV